MLKKIIIAVLVLAVAAAFSLNLLRQKAPALLRDAIEKALDKKVKIGAIIYHFPGVFELEGFEIQEKAPFEGERSFSVAQIKLHVSPLSLSQKALIIDDLEVEDAEIIVRKFHGKLWHSLSDATKKMKPVSESTEARERGKASGPTIPLEIRHFKIDDSHFKFLDYDAMENGFVVALEAIDAEIRDVSIPLSDKKTSYVLNARLPQGRDQRVAEIRLSGWTRFENFDTDANLSLSGVYLPYFEPYYGQVTPAHLRDGYLDARANLRVDRKDLTANVDFGVQGLYFESYEAGNQLFGLKADEILAFLKDSSGKLSFQIVVRWNIADRSVKLKDVIRKGIERSLKNTVLSNVGNILENTIKKIGEGGIDSSKDNLEDVVKKVKELFR